MKAVGCSRDALKNACRDTLVVQDNGKLLLKDVREYFRGRRTAQVDAVELKRQKLEAEVADKKAATKLKGLEESRLRGEMHAVKDCSASIGLLLSTTWQEIMALPSRLASAFPENPRIEGVAVSLVNECADRLQDFLKEHTPK